MNENKYEFYLHSADANLRITIYTFFKRRMFNEILMVILMLYLQLYENDILSGVKLILPEK